MLTQDYIMNHFISMIYENRKYMKRECGMDVELLVIIFKFLKKNINGKIILVLILIGMTYAFTKSDYYRENFQVPRCNLVHTGEQDIVKADIKLASMSITVTPLITIKRENEVVYAVKVENYYNANYASCDGSNEDISSCTVDVADEQQLKIVSLSRKIKELLGEKLKEHNESANVEVYIAYLVYITWQNENSYIVKDGYWYFTDGIERHITKQEVEKWVEKMKSEIDLDNYEEEGFIYNNDQLMQVIDSCDSMIFE